MGRSRKRTMGRPLRTVRPLGVGVSKGAARRRRATCAAVVPVSCVTRAALWCWDDKHDVRQEAVSPLRAPRRRTDTNLWRRLLSLGNKQPAILRKQTTRWWQWRYFDRANNIACFKVQEMCTIDTTTSFWWCGMPAIPPWPMSHSPFPSVSPLLCIAAKRRGNPA